MEARAREEVGGHWLQRLLAAAVLVFMVTWVRKVGNEIDMNENYARQARAQTEISRDVHRISESMRIRSVRGLCQTPLPPPKSFDQNLRRVVEPSEPLTTFGTYEMRVESIHPVWRGHIAPCTLDNPACAPIGDAP